MVDKKPGVLILSPFFSPNIGGVESHLDDLVSALDKREYKVFVQTYSPDKTFEISLKFTDKVFSKDIERATQHNYRMEKLLEENTSYFWMPT